MVGFCARSEGRPRRMNRVNLAALHPASSMKLGAFVLRALYPWIHLGISESHFEVEAGVAKALQKLRAGLQQNKTSCGSTAHMHA